jgi:hypothetical protein
LATTDGEDSISIAATGRVLRAIVTSLRGWVEVLKGSTFVAEGVNFIKSVARARATGSGRNISRGAASFHAYLIEGVP